MALPPSGGRRPRFVFVLDKLHQRYRPSLLHVIIVPAGYRLRDDEYDPV